MKNTPQYSIIFAETSHFPQILDCIKELAEFERAPEKVTNTVEKMEDEQEHFRCLVAITPQGEVLGIALYFFAYFTWVGKSLYLDDIYIRPQFRNLGIGKQLLRLVFEEAKKEKCHRVRWQVLNWNTNAIELYKQAKATLDDEWINCDYDEEGILNFKV